MAESVLLVKSKSFALCIIRFCNDVKKEQRESVLMNQLLRSGTSIGTNIREAFYAHSRAFSRGIVAKLKGLQTERIKKMN